MPRPATWDGRLSSKYRAAPWLMTERSRAPKIKASSWLSGMPISLVVLWMASFIESVIVIMSRWRSECRVCIFMVLWGFWGRTGGGRASPGYTIICRLFLNWLPCRFARIAFQSGATRSKSVTRTSTPARTRAALQLGAARVRQRARGAERRGRAGVDGGTEGGAGLH